LIMPPTWRQTGTVSSSIDIEWTGANAADSLESAADIRSSPQTNMLLRSWSPGTFSPDIPNIVFEGRVPSDVMTANYRPNDQAIDIDVLNTEMDQFFEAVLPEQLASRLPASRSAATTLRRFVHQAVQASRAQPPLGATELDVQGGVVVARTEEPTESVNIPRDRVFSTLHRPSSAPQQSETPPATALLLEHDSDTGNSDSAKESDSEVGIAVTSTEAGSTPFTAAAWRHGIEDAPTTLSPPQRSRRLTRSRSGTPEYRSSRADRGYTHEIGYAGERWVSLDFPLMA
jgi:hypothetical protein